MPEVVIPKDEPVKAQELSKKELDVKDFAVRRVNELKEARKQPLPGISRSVEDIWRDADRELTPHELGFEKPRKRLESDEETGLRSRLVKIGSDENWQSNQASPDFYVKVVSAMSILVGMNPEAVFLPASKRYQANTELAYGNWKNSWEVSDAKQQLKNYIFNLAKYGTAFGLTYPKIIEQKKRIRTEYYKNEPDKDKYEERNIIKFNDLCRESLNPWQVWVSEMARPGNSQSIDDWYYEKDYSWDSFRLAFKDYPEIEAVAKGSVARPENEDVQKSNTSIDGVTVGFYENQVLDLYVVFVPSSGVILYQSPLPNDDGMLSLWLSQWTLRDDRSIYGIGLFEIIRQDSVLFDRLLNMTMDQLTLSIYKSFFYKGTDILADNGKLIIGPGEGKQVNDPQAINWLQVPGPGSEAWQGLNYLQNRKDLISGVTQQLSGDYSGKTLGQDLQAKEAALARMKTPLDYIIDALQQEAYLSLSWQKQILSTPEILEYTDPELLAASLKEMGLADEEIQKYVQEAQNPNPQSELLFTDGTQNEQGQSKTYANVYKESAFSLDKDEKGELIESEDRRFYRWGIDLPTKRLEWKGIIRIKPQSILAPSKELTKRQKLDMFNLVYPAIQAMLAAPQFVPVLLLPIKQIIQANEENVKDWIDEKALQTMAEAAAQPKAPTEPDIKPSISIKYETLTPQIQVQVLDKYLGIKVEAPLFVGANSNPMERLGMGNPLEAPASAGTPQDNQPQPPQGQLEGQLEAQQIKPLAQIGEAPTSLGGAVTGATAM